MIYYRYIADQTDKRTAQHNAGIELLKKGLSEEYGLNISDDMISADDYGKPYLKDHPEIYFSITHCDGLAACMISDHECGIDAEKIRSFRPSTAKRVCSDNELKLLNSSNDENKDGIFTTLWTLKEAYSKYDGRGISVMKNASFDFHDGQIVSNMPQLHFYSRFIIDKGYIISVCSESDDDIFIDDRFSYNPYIK